MRRAEMFFPVNKSEKLHPLLRSSFFSFQTTEIYFFIVLFTSTSSGKLTLRKHYSQLFDDVKRISELSSEREGLQIKRKARAPMTLIVEGNLQYPT